MPRHRRQPPEWIDDAPIVFENSIEIAAPPAAVWTHVADHVGWTDWLTILDRVEVTGAPAGIGGRRRVHVGPIRLDEVFTAWTEHEQFAFAVVQSPLLFVDAMVEDVRLEPSTLGCRVTYRQGIAGKTGCDPIVRLAFRKLSDDTGSALDRLRALAEA